MKKSDLTLINVFDYFVVSNILKREIRDIVSKKIIFLFSFTMAQLGKTLKSISESIESSKVIAKKSQNTTNYFYVAIQALS